MGEHSDGRVPSEYAKDHLSKPSQPHGLLAPDEALVPEDAILVVAVSGSWFVVFEKMRAQPFISCVFALVVVESGFGLAPDNKSTSTVKQSNTTDFARVVRRAKYRRIQ
jgi:hypothetical protein